MMHSHRLINLVRLLLIIGIAGANAATSTRAQNTTPTTSPADDVMHSTERGLRLTPDLGGALAQAYVHDTYSARLGLSDEHEIQFSQRLADRLLKLAGQNAQASEQFIESALENAMQREARDPSARPTVEGIKTLAEKSQPLAPVWRELLDGIAEDGKGVIDEQQTKRLKRILATQRRQLDQFTTSVDRIRKGEIKPQDDPLKELAAAFDEQNLRDEKPPVIAAERQVQYEMSHCGPAEWRTLMDAARISFQFDAQQRAKSESIFNEYRVRARAMMTPEWLSKVRRNRLRHNLIAVLKEPTAPSLYHLNQSYGELMNPVSEMGERFRKEIMALATDEQRQSFLRTVNERATAHGLKMDDVDRSAVLAFAK